MTIQIWFSPNWKINRVELFAVKSNVHPFSLSSITANAFSVILRYKHTAKQSRNSAIKPCICKLKNGYCLTRVTRQRMWVLALFSNVHNVDYAFSFQNVLFKMRSDVIIFCVWLQSLIIIIIIITTKPNQTKLNQTNRIKACCSNFHAKPKTVAVISTQRDALIVFIWIFCFKNKLKIIHWAVAYQFERAIANQFVKPLGKVFEAHQKSIIHIGLPSKFSKLFHESPTAWENRFHNHIFQGVSYMISETICYLDWKET